MRPTRLELDGFASFRQPTTIDFTDADLFVLSGPTGAGKSSIIDAITFCLYGVVARYNDKRAVEPVISNGRNEARVALQFSVAGINHTAVRVVRRTRTGASTKEARLEVWRGDDPSDARAIAATADEVSDAVHDLLGLGYEHFTRTVVLPQGAFQQFLHGTQKDRSDLLNELLAVGVFDTVASAARTRAATLQGEVKTLQAQLDGELGEVTDEQVATAAARVAALGDAVEAIDAARGDIDDILARGREQAGTLEALKGQQSAVAKVRRPDGIDDLVARRRDTTAAATTATQALADAEQAHDAAEATLDDLPSADAVTAQEQRLQETDKVTTRRSDADAAVTAATGARDRADAAVQTATAALANADTALQEAQRGNLVATLVADVHAGDPCPVCARPLDDEVDVDAAALDHARQARTLAAETVDTARREAGTAATTLARAEAARDAAAARHDELTAQVVASELPDQPQALAELATTVTAATAARTNARSTARKARTRVTETRTALEQATSALGAARQSLSNTRDEVAALGPPTVDADDLGTAWDQLATWARTTSADLGARIEQATSAVDTSRTAYRTALAALKQDLDGHKVTMDGITTTEALRDAFVAARADATTAHAQLQQRRARRARVGDKLDAARRSAAVATELGRLLDKRNFQRWLTTRAVHHLIVGATRHLEQLTNGAYALALDDKDEFAIVDHTNGGQLRTARSLSGGETFLASLSLALALSENVADLAAGGAARLESLFIDEGFGTLDAATIDVVRTALEELGATGRMVGVVTHVPALAEQLPVQFRVRKEAQTSVVERVEV